MPAGSLYSAFLGTGAKALEALGKGITPSSMKTLLAYGIPAVTVMELLNLTPTGEVIGEYMKNKLVPGLDEYNKNRELEVAAKLEMGAKQLPSFYAANAAKAIAQQGRDVLVAKATAKKPEILKKLSTDPMLVRADKDVLTRLLDSIISTAPNVVINMPDAITSVIRSAVTMGTDTLDPQSYQMLANLESSIL